MEKAEASPALESVPRKGIIIIEELPHNV